MAVKKEEKRKYSRQAITLFYGAILAVIVGTLVYFEQIAALYILVTLGLVAILLIISFTDLETKIAELKRR